MQYKYTFFLIFVFTLFIGLDSFSQTGDLIEYNQQRENITRTGMKVLGSWAVVNIISGGIGYYRGSGENKYFHQMNAFWNTVNLGLAGYALLQSPAIHESLSATLTAQQSIEKLLLFNAALDAGYIMTGFYLRERAKSNSNPERFRGYGNSLILQGGFLMAFDWTLYLILNNHSKSLHPIIEGLSFTGNALRFTYNF